MNDLQAATAMAEALTTRGLMAPDVANAEISAMRKERGLDPLPAMGAPGTRTDNHRAPDESTADVDSLDAEIFAGPSDAKAYRFTLPPGEVTADMQSEVREIQAAFHKVGMPVALAAEISRQFAEGAANPPDAAQLEVLRQSGMARLHQLHGDGTAEVLAIARQQFELMCAQYPGLRDLSDRSGLSCSPWVVSTLATLGRVRR